MSCTLPSLLCANHTHCNCDKIILQGTNAVFVYELADTATGVPFRINPTSGLISVSGPLDYETTTSYTFTVRFPTVEGWRGEGRGGREEGRKERRKRGEGRKGREGGI